MLNHLSLAEVSAHIAARRVSPVELLFDCLTQINSTESSLNAFVRVPEDEAIAMAQRAEAEIQRDGPKSPMHGIPVGLKDNIDKKGEPTTCCSYLRMDHIAARDAVVVSRLRQNGAVLAGKLTTHEFAFAGPCFDLPFPPSRNPWDTTRLPGGSSSGSAVAVAARMLPAALGSDTGGSIRNPAGACGVVGLKPTYELVSREGVFPLAPSLDHIGPLTRTVEDNAILLGAIFDNDRWGQGASNYCTDLRLGVKGLRIGVIRHFHEVDIPASASVISALNGAERVFAREGAIIGTAALPPLSEFSAVNTTLLLTEAAAVHERSLREHAEKYGTWTRKRLLPGFFFSGVDYLQAQRRRLELIRIVDAVFQDYDVLMAANSMDAPCLIDDQEELERLQPRHARSPFSLTGHPAISLMCGVSVEELPLSLQLIAPAFKERLLYRVAHAFERATEWYKLAPTL